MAGPKTLDEYIQKPLGIEQELNVLLNGRKNLVIFDVGACEGEDAIRYSKLFPEADVFAFEPRPDNFKSAEDLISRYQARRVKLFPFALSNSRGTATFHLSSGQPESGADSWNYGNKSSSLLAPSEQSSKHHPWLKFENTIEVQTITMDDFCMEHGVDHIDYMHMDVQGAELMVLSGAHELLKKTLCIWMEVESVELYKGQPLKPEVENFMKSNSFECVLSTVGKVSGDQLYINRNLVAEKEIKKLNRLENRRRLRNKLYSFYNRIRSVGS